MHIIKLLEKNKQKLRPIASLSTILNFIRGFFEENKGVSLQDTIRCWKQKNYSGVQQL